MNEAGLLRRERPSRSDGIPSGRAFELGKVQAGEEPSDWKPMTTVGAGVREIRIRSEAGAFRVMYVVARGDRIFVLHCFQKKSQRTAGRDLDLAAWRFGEVKGLLR